MNWLNNLEQYMKQVAVSVDKYSVSIGSKAVELKSIFEKHAKKVSLELYQEIKTVAKNIDVQLGKCVDKIMTGLQVIASAAQNLGEQPKKLTGHGKIMVSTAKTKTQNKIYKTKGDAQILIVALALPFKAAYSSWKQVLLIIRHAAQNAAAKPGMWHKECLQVASASREASGRYVKNAARRLSSQMQSTSILLKDIAGKSGATSASAPAAPSPAAEVSDSVEDLQQSTGNPSDDNEPQDENPFSKEKLLVYWNVICVNGVKYYDMVKSFSHEEFRVFAKEMKEMLHIRDEGEDVYSPVYRAINKKPRRAVMLMFTSITVLIVAGIIWASLTEIKGYANAIGRIETYDQLQNVTAYDGAIIKQILVEEDQAVTKGQQLIILDSTIYDAKHKDLQERYYTKLGHIAAIEAQLSNKKPEFDPSIIAFSERIYNDSVSFYTARVNLNSTTIAALDGQISHKEKEILDSTHEQALYVESISLVQKQVDILTKLSANELVSKLKLLDMQKELLITKMKLKTVEADLMRKEGELKVAQDKKDAYLSNLYKDTLAELADHRNEISSTLADLTALQTQLGRTIITSPIDGIIYKIANRSVASHISSSQEIISIVPSTGRLVMTAMVSPDEIGFIKKGQAVSIKVATFDYSIYGDLKGTVEKISPETTQDKTDGRFYYQVVVKAQNNYLEYKGRRMYIKPGMKATADFSLDNKTVMQYIFNPFVKVMHESLGGH